MCILGLLLDAFLVCSSFGIKEKADSHFNFVLFAFFH